MGGEEYDGQRGFRMQSFGAVSSKTEFSPLFDKFARNDVSAYIHAITYINSLNVYQVYGDGKKTHS